ncbi:MAG: 16S rRNA (cytidine(1402)-2'-O)-methyltransferase [Woeseiaceae bacterium]|nr:16S rRNA (cytidine(1402)-2'-O)-methyltransferase [Woeseiaceae bacterium]
MSGTLFIVATPIGNLDDLSPRAREALGAVDLIAAEDTRRTGRLLSHFGVKTPQFALHEHNENAACDKLLGRLGAGESVALVSDAGTPLISDPGYRLVRAAHEQGIAVVTIPGPSAVTAALSAAGLPTDRFCFEGFLPARQAARRARLAELAGETRTMVFFEAVHRIRACVDDLAEIMGAKREAFLARELTKLHEQCVRGSLGELAAGLASGAIPGKGEFVLVVAGAAGGAGPGVDIDRLLGDLAAQLPAREAARIAARATGLGRNALYRRLLELAGD